MSTMKEISKMPSKKIVAKDTVEIPIKQIIDDIIVVAQDTLNLEIKSQRNGLEVDKVHVQYLLDLCFNINKKHSTRSEALNYYDDLSETWINLCADYYFEKHPNVLNVLMIVDEEAGEKFWIGCR